MLGLALGALPQKLVAEAAGFAIEAIAVACFTWHIASGYESSKFNAERAAQSQAVADAEERARTTDRQLAAARQEIVDAQTTAKLQVAATAAAFSADADRLRGQLATSLGGHDRPDDTLVACQQRAATAGNLLADGLQLQGKLAAAAESHAADLRAVRAFDTQVKAAQSAASAP